jgi:hypothetical protein
MAFVKSVLNWWLKKRIHQIELFKKYPHEVQDEVFKKLVSTARDTEWGKKYDYRSIDSINDYQNRVPISSYEDIKPLIDRLRKGEQNILWPEEITWFAKSSGTTAGKSKFIPVSPSALDECHFKGGKDMLGIYLNLFPDSELFEGKSLVMGGSRDILEVSNTTYIEGDLSAILMHNLPFWAQFKRTPSLTIALMDEWENKLELMVESTMSNDVRGISGVPSWMLVFLRRVLEKSGKTNIHDIWPNLEVFFHGGINFEPYREQYNSILSPDKIVYSDTYNASEGFFGIQDQKDNSDLLLMLDYGVFYEFIPANDFDPDNPKIVQLADVKIGINYAIIISTNAGLWRYMIGDTVVFTCLSPFRIRITGRVKNFLNAVGEELIIDNAEKAFSVACLKTNAIISEFTAAPLFENDEVVHQWLIEFEKEPDNPDFFNELFDNALKSVNSDYEAKRYHNLVLKQPIIVSLKKGTFYNWMKQRNKLGGQYKVPRLSGSREYVDAILKLQIN